MKDKLAVAEMFYSIQGEGRTLGVPAIFLRLAGCNLMCGGAGTQKDKQLHDGATWRCDTIEVWLKGRKEAFQDIVERMPGFEHLSSIAHLVITGGEPLLQMEEIENFIKFVDNGFFRPFIEIETNGTIQPSNYLLRRIDQWNVSPKLMNSGMSARDRINPNALSALAAARDSKGNKTAIFKFVVSHKGDWTEIVNSYLTEIDIKQEQVYLMPATDSVETYGKMAQRVIEICKEEAVHFSPREHIAVWNQKTGV